MVSPPINLAIPQNATLTGGVFLCRKETNYEIPQNEIVPRVRALLDGVDAFVGGRYLNNG